MFGIDAADTKAVEIGGITWRIGYVPAAKMMELQIADAAARRAARAEAVRVRASLPADATDEAVGAAMQADAAYRAAQDAAVPGLVALWVETCRWGLAGWDGTSLPARRVPVASMGSTFQILDQRVGDALARAHLPDGRSLAQALAAEIMTAHALSLDEIRGF